MACSGLTATVEGCRIVLGTPVDGTESMYVQPVHTRCGEPSASERTVNSPCKWQIPPAEDIVVQTSDRKVKSNDRTVRLSEETVRVSDRTVSLGERTVFWVSQLLTWTKEKSCKRELSWYELNVRPLKCLLKYLYCRTGHRSEMTWIHLWPVCRKATISNFTGVWRPASRLWCSSQPLTSSVASGLWCLR